MLRGAFALTMGLAVLCLTGCDGVADDTGPQDQLVLEGPFVKVPRAGQALHAGATKKGVKQQGLDGGFEGVDTAGDQAFYIAININELPNKWFLSAFLTQWEPSSNLPVQSLGTKVVSFKQQNGKLFVFDVTPSRQWSDTLSPQVVIEAYPIVTDYTPFNRLSNHANYVLFDPAAGLNQFSFVTDAYASSYQVQFDVDVAYSQNFRKLADGVTWDEIFTGTSAVPAPGIFANDQPFRGSGTLGMSLRRYFEGQGFTAFPYPQQPYFFSADPYLVKNTGNTASNAIKWNFHPGMTPVRWYISDAVGKLSQNPKYAGYDLYGAISRGITGWNQVFGYNVFDVAPAQSTDNVGQDEKSYLFFDPNPAAGLAFANWRNNPTTGEIRGASVYLSNAFIDLAIDDFTDLDGGTLGGGSTPLDGGTGTGSTDGGTFRTAGGLAELAPRPRSGAALSWGPLAHDRICSLDIDDAKKAFANADDSTVSGMTKKEKVERYLTHVVLHEIGHTLGLRHNFKGSLAKDSVMDYLTDTESIVLDVPGAYDVSALQYLYGLTPGAAAPTQPFCTDEYVAVDPQCTIFDRSNDPLALYWGPVFTERANAMMFQGDGNFTFYQMDKVLDYVRTGNQTVQAFALATAGGIAPPIDSTKLAMYPTYAPYADLLAQILLWDLYLAPPEYRGDIVTPPAATDPVTPNVIAMAKAVLVNSDNIRSFESRRTMVDVLKAIQTNDAYFALVDARTQIANTRSQYTVQSQQLIDELLRRIDAATYNYFQ